MWGMDDPSVVVGTYTRTKCQSGSGGITPPPHINTYKQTHRDVHVHELELRVGPRRLQPRGLKLLAGLSMGERLGCVVVLVSGRDVGCMDITAADTHAHTRPPQIQTKSKAHGSVRTEHHEAW